jgi:23S rRNA (guanosine2251-2'-O)-methyltransferase
VSETFESKKWSKEFLALTKRAQIKVQVQKEKYFNKLSQVSQGVSCDVTEDPEWPDENADRLFLLALDGVEDPHNFGAILRTAWLMGVDGILLPEKESAPMTATVGKVASGGAEHVPLLRVKNLKLEIDSLKKKGFWSYALAVDDKAEDIKSVVKSDKTILIAGAEESGIRPSLIQDSDFKVYIPQTDATASLNVSVSVAVGVWTLKS